MQFQPADRLALCRAFREAVRTGANTPRDVVMLVKYRYIQALAMTPDGDAAEHYIAVVATLSTCKIDVRAWAREVIDREKKRKP